MVQKRGISKVHEDDHYCAAIFHYLKKFSVCFCDHYAMVSTDDENNEINESILFQA